jgi:hypothetical protein
VKSKAKNLLINIVRSPRKGWSNSFKDLKEPLAKRAAKEQAAVSKEERDRKCKIQDAPLEAEAGMSGLKKNITQASEQLQPTPWKVPVAGMY